MNPYHAGASRNTVRFGTQELSWINRHVRMAGFMGVGGHREWQEDIRSMGSGGGQVWSVGGFVEGPEQGPPHACPFPTPCSAGIIRQHGCAPAAATASGNVTL